MVKKVRSAGLHPRNEGSFEEVGLNDLLGAALKARKVNGPSKHFGLDALW